MAFLSVPNVEIVGIAACVPAQKENNHTSPLIPDSERRNLIEKTGIEEKRVARGRYVLPTYVLKQFRNSFLNLNGIVPRLRR